MNKTEQIFLSVGHSFELKRIKILIVIFGAISLLSLANGLLAADKLISYFEDLYNYFILVSISFTFTVFLLIRYLLVWRQMKLKRTLPTIYQWVSSFIEISFPTISMFVFLSIRGPQTLSDSPAFVFYFIFLISSIFYLNPRVSIFIGVVAAVSYSLVGILSEIGEMSIPPAAYHGRSVLIFFAGLVSAAVANEIRQRVRQAIESQEDSDQITKLFNQQVSSEVVEALRESSSTVSRKEVTIMFLDIRGFSNTVEHMSPEDINKFQNNVLGPLIEIINAHHGVVNQLLGDGFMASFGAPLERQDHAITALRASIEIFDHLEQSKDLSVNVGIGMHSGRVVTGNIGTKDRQQYSISGTAVIVAARLEQLNKQYASSCLVSESFFEEAKSEITEYQKLGETDIKGIGEPVQVFQLR